MTSTTIRLRPRWWQFIRRFREWREDRALLGKAIVIDCDGNRYEATITRWDAAGTATVTIDTSDPFFVVGSTYRVLPPDDWDGEPYDFTVAEPGGET